MSSGLSDRASQLNPFHVMDILARARQMEQDGTDVCHLEIGEPDFSTPVSITEAGIRALQSSQTHYTQALGMPALRHAIADYYQARYGLNIDHSRVIVTTGASGAIQMALLSLLDHGDELLLADPGYPCNRNIAQLLSVNVRGVPVDADSGYQLSAQHIDDHWSDRTRAAMVASPSNPTGTLIEQQQLMALYQNVTRHGGHLIVDEIYQGLVYDAQDTTALQSCDDCFVINSFSKYFAMTGWRVGWMVVPDAFVDAIDRIAQNIFLAPPTMSQFAAIEALSERSRLELDQRRDVFRQRRDFLLPALKQLGFSIPVDPQGAFYIYADCGKFADDSFTWSKRLLHDKSVAITPGIDFGQFQADTHCRFAYTRPVDKLEQAVERIDRFIRS
jgi:aspartate/methionine/tyrosine aminotransferase